MLLQEAVNSESFEAKSMAMHEFLQITENFTISVYLVALSDVFTPKMAKAVN